MNKTQLIIASAVTVTALGRLTLLGRGYAQAETASKYPPLIQKLVDKFNLDTNEVDKVIEEEKNARQAQREQMPVQRQKEIEDKLTQAVSDGKITEEQKTKILAKIAELRPTDEEKPVKHDEDWKNLTPAERQIKMEEFRKEMDQRRTDFEAWQKDLGVNLNDTLGDLTPLNGNGPKGGFGGMGGKGPWNNK